MRGRGAARRGPGVSCVRGGCQRFSSTPQSVVLGHMPPALALAPSSTLTRGKNAWCLHPFRASSLLTAAACSSSNAPYASYLFLHLLLAEVLHVEALTTQERVFKSQSLHSATIRTSGFLLIACAHAQGLTSPSKARVLTYTKNAPPRSLVTPSAPTPSPTSPPFSCLHSSTYSKVHSPTTMQPWMMPGAFKTADKPSLLCPRPCIDALWVPGSCS